MVIFPCSFAPNHGAKGDKPEGLWRCQAGVRLNGLFMYDADELSKKHGMTPVELYNKLPEWLFDSKEVRHIVGAHVTPSGDGLRLIGTCDPERGNLADHQQWLGSILGVPCDESVKDASRGSFMVDDEMILYLDKSIFTYNDEEYDKKYGECYRGNGGTGAREYENTPAADTSRTTAPPYPRTNENYTVGSVPLCNYHDVPYEKIVEVYCARYPNYSSGDRHEHLKVMAGRLRYIVDNSPAKLKQLVRLAPYVKDWEKAEHNQKEIDDLCDGACALKFYISKPKVVKDVLQRAGVVETEETAYNEMAASSDLALRVFAQRLEGLMAEPYKSVMQDQNPMNAIPLIFASGTMFCTLLTRCWYIHYDGKPQRMNPQSLTIAPPASGKGEIAELNKFLLAPVKTADEYARKVENEYKKEYDKRQTSTKALKGDALEEPQKTIVFEKQ